MRTHMYHSRCPCQSVTQVQEGSTPATHPDSYQYKYKEEKESTMNVSKQGGAREFTKQGDNAEESKKFGEVFEQARPPKWEDAH